jgi:hypothetical protein
MTVRCERLRETLIEEAVDVRGPKEDFLTDSNPECARFLPTVTLCVKRTWGETQIVSSLSQCEKRFWHSTPPSPTRGLSISYTTKGRGETENAT